MPPTARYGEYVTVGSLMMGSRAIEAYDWQGFLTYRKRAEVTRLLGQTGRQAEDTIGDSVRDLLLVRINGEWEHDPESPVGPDLASKVDKAYEHYNALKAVAAVDGEQTFTLHHHGTDDTAQCRVLDMTVRGRLNPWVWEYALDIILPYGALVVT